MPIDSILDSMGVESAVFFVMQKDSRWGYCYPTMHCRENGESPRCKTGMILSGGLHSWIIVFMRRLSSMEYPLDIKSSRDANKSHVLIETTLIEHLTHWWWYGVGRLCFKHNWWIIPSRLYIILHRKKTYFVFSAPFSFSRCITPIRQRHSQYWISTIKCRSWSKSQQYQHECRSEGGSKIQSTAACNTHRGW